MNPGRRCAACKYLRRRCPQDCIFSSCFPSNIPQKFEFIHKIYGASNVAKILQQIPEDERSEAADSLYFEASCRIEDPVYGCVGIISLLQSEIQTTEHLLAKTNAQIAIVRTTLSDSNFLLKID